MDGVKMDSGNGFSHVHVSIRNVPRDTVGNVLVPTWWQRMMAMATPSTCANLTVRVNVNPYFYAAVTL